MRKKIAFILTLIMLACSIDALADTDNPGSESLGEAVEVLTESENLTEAADSTEADDSTSSEKEEPSFEEETETQQETDESIQETDKAGSETLAEETLPVSEEETLEEGTKPISEEIPKKEKENPAKLQKEEEFLSEDDTIYNVSFPADTHVYMDPDNLSGKGQIFSERYEIENFGNTDVAIKIKQIEIDYRTENGSYEFSETEITDELPQIKKMAVDMVWEKEDGADKKVLHVADGFPDEYVIELKAAQHGRESTGFFYFTGTMNADPNINWEDDDLNVTFYYEILSLADRAEEDLADEDDGKYGSEKNGGIPDIKSSDMEFSSEAAETTESEPGPESEAVKEPEGNQEETESKENLGDSTSESKETEENHIEPAEAEPEEVGSEEAELKETSGDST